MGQIVRPFANLLSPGPKQLPAGPLRIEWSHPLARGLIGCWAPGISGRNVAGGGGDMTYVGVGAPPIAATVEGVGLRNTTVASGMLGVATPRMHDFRNGGTLYWRGYIHGADSGGYPYFLLTQDVADEAHNRFILSRAGTPYVFLNEPPLNSYHSFTTNTIQSCGGTYSPNGDGYLRAFVNGAQYGNTELRNVGDYGPSRIGLNSADNNNYLNATTMIAMMWDRGLTNDEMAWLDQEPYAFLVPDTLEEISVTDIPDEGVAGGGGPLYWPPFANTRGQLQVPKGPLRIDWQHPLARGLIGCWVPGAMGGINLGGSPFAGEPTAMSPGPEGVGGGTAASQTLPSSSPFRTWTELTIYARGHTTGEASGAYDIFSPLIPYGTAQAPWIAADIQFSGNPPTFAAEWNSGGGSARTAQFNHTLDTTVRQPFSVGATFKVGGSVYCYWNGAQDGTNSFGADPPATVDGCAVSLSANKTFAYIGCIWNRQLTADEMAWLDREPYAFLAYDAPEAVTVVGSPPDEAVGTAAAPAFRPYLNLLNPGPKQVPTGRLRLDRRHPLAQGLIACYLPGVSFTDVANYGPTLAPNNPANLRLTGSVEGPALKYTEGYGGLYCALVGTFSPNSRFCYSDKFSLHWRGTKRLDNHDNDWGAGLMRVGGNGVNTAAGFHGDGGINTMNLQWGPTTGWDRLLIADLSGMVGQTISLGGSIQVGGTVRAFFNGAYANSKNYVGGACTYTDYDILIGAQADHITECDTYIAACWDRYLSDEEHAWLDREPYCFLLPDDELEQLTLEPEFEPANDFLIA